MKTKNLLTIFIVLLAITLVSGLAIFLTEEKNQPALNRADQTVNYSNQSLEDEKQLESELIDNEAAEVVPAAPEKIVEAQKSEKAEAPETVNSQMEEKIQAVMLINGVTYQIAVKPDSSVYDLMKALKQENKIDFSGKDYSGMGFFVEEISGVKNNLSGKNWVYYVNGKPAQVGISYYIIKAGDIIEWKYEKKSF